MNILLLDNYDSFTYNLVHALQEVAPDIEVSVFRNDKISVEEAGYYDAIVLSPGPGLPSESGILMELIERYMPTKPIFGVCLGQQAIGEVLGGQLLQLDAVHHGVQHLMTLDTSVDMFDGLPEVIPAGRYHSWVIDREVFPEEALRITATDADGHIMAVQHRQFDTYAVQFHPESIMTPHGTEIIKRWIALVRKRLQHEEQSYGECN